MDATWTNPGVDGKQWTDRNVMCTGLSAHSDTALHGGCGADLCNIPDGEAQFSSTKLIRCPLVCP